jgi:hypothetical protein
MQQSDVTRPNLTHPVEVQCENMRCLGNEELYELIVQLFIRLVLHNLLSPARGKRAARAQARSKERVNKKLAEKTCGTKTCDGNPSVYPCPRYQHSPHLYQAVASLLNSAWSRAFSKC